jgi:uncharacterized membrane protein (UPF0127 family)
VKRGAIAALLLLPGACSPQPVPANSEQVAAPATAAVAANAPAEPAGEPQTGLRQVPLTITSATGTHAFTVDVAATPDQQETGLMFVKHLAPDRGMIFPYDPPQPVAFWLHNTLIPLDIIYIRPDGTIARIANAKPLDDTPLPSGERISAVLEIAGGRADELGIKPGDKVDWTR